MPVRIAVLVKQVPRFEEMRLGPDGRLQREGVELEMNPYCRRAVAKGVELAREHGGTCTVYTLGPPPAEDSLREAVAWGADEGVHICDPAFAGSDTLATARALAAALRREGPFDLVLAGRNSVDADTGQVGPEVAELLDLPFACGVRELEVKEGARQGGPSGGNGLPRLSVRCEHDDGYVRAKLDMPALLSTAERLCDPAKVAPEGRAAVDAGRIRTLRAADLGPGPWGQEGSPTWVGAVRVLEVERERRRLEGPPAEQVRETARVLADRGVLAARRQETTGSVPERSSGSVPRQSATDGAHEVLVLVEPERRRLARELIGSAAHLASHVGGRVVALHLAEDTLDPAEAGSWGADEVVTLRGAAIEEDVAAGGMAFVEERPPWAVLAPGTAWGREVASRMAVRLGAGLTGDAVELDVERHEARAAGAGKHSARVVGWKPAFGGRLVAAITATSPVQMTTVRPGVLPLLEPRHATPAARSTLEVTPRRRVHVSDRTRDDELDALATANVVVGVGTGVRPEEYGELEPLLHLFDAELGATRKVTDKGWLPRSRQVGITGRSIAPALYVALGVAGKFNHMVGVRSAGFVLALNRDPDALVFDAADLGIVGDWHEVVPLLVEELVPRRAAV